MSKIIYVLDTSTVFNLGHRGRLERLAEHLSREHDLWITPQVRGEIKQEVSQAYFKQWIEPLVKERKPTGGKISLEQVARLAEVIHPAEISVIMLAAENEATASLDEKLARREAAALDVNTTGTLGLLKMGFERGWMTDNECLQAVHRMRHGSFRIPALGANDDFLTYIARV